MPTPERSFRSEAVILKHIDWGEADRLLTLYTREMGKVRAVGKGVRKIRSRKAGHLEPFTQSKLLLARGREILLITQAETIDAFLAIRDNLTLTGYASYVVELLDRFTYEEEENCGIYELLVATLSRLSKGENPFTVIRYYEIRLLDLLGFRPVLFKCIKCGEDILPQDQFFSAALGGVLCPHCGENVSEARPVSMSALKFLRHFQRSSYVDAVRAQVPSVVQYEIETLIQHYLTYLLERSLNTPAFLRRLQVDQRRT